MLSGAYFLLLAHEHSPNGANQTYLVAFIQMRSANMDESSLVDPGYEKASRKGLLGHRVEKFSRSPVLRRLDPLPLFCAQIKYLAHAHTL